VSKITDARDNKFEVDCAKWEGNYLKRVK
ncbi:electron transfer flavoprotein, beta subunit, partial [Clostridium autoethanogenum]